MRGANDTVIANRKELLHEVARIRAALHLLADDADDRRAQLYELERRIGRLRAAAEGRRLLDARTEGWVFTGLARLVDEARQERSGLPAEPQQWQRR
jgi:2-methylisocitrate lyase-like PEP mutase family enzyme